MNPILTCKYGTNADLFPDIMKVYAEPGDVILDMTYGRGVFWSNIEKGKYTLIENDKDKKKGQLSADLRAMPFAEETFDVVIMDPPYVFGAGGKDMLDKQYGNNEYRKQGSPGPDAVVELFRSGISEANRLLKNDGILIVKCMDFISGGKQQRISIRVLEEAIDRGLTDEDLFVLHQSGNPIMRHNYQLHARKNHSYFWVFRK